MQIWVENEENLGPNQNSISRLWTGSSDDVVEVSIDVPSDQDEAISLIGLVPWILVRCSDWTMIPLENLIACSRGTQTRIAAAIDKEIENFAYLIVKDKLLNNQIFQGWMFSSSPSLSSLEHPINDIWLLNCINKKAK